MPIGATVWGTASRHDHHDPAVVFVQCDERAGVERHAGHAALRDRSPRPLVLFTIAAVAADPDAATLLSHTDGWLAMIQRAREADIKARTAVASADALRVVANHRLDTVCVAFGDDLYMAVDKDQSSPRWRRFFSVAVSRFVRQALPRQARTVRGWLTRADDAVLLKHKAALSTWCDKVDDALTKTAALAIVRGEAWATFEQLAEQLPGYEACAERLPRSGRPVS